MNKPARLRSIIFLFLISSQYVLFGQLTECKATLQNDTLIIENNKLRRSFLWNNGNLKHINLFNKTTKSIIGGDVLTDKTDMVFPGVKPTAGRSSFRTYIVGATNASYEYLAAEAITSIGSFELKRVFRIYADCPALVCDYFVKGKADGWKNFFAEGETLRNIEDEHSKKSAEGKVLLTDRISFKGNHWRIKSVEFFDASDYNNNLVQEYSRLVYRQENRLRGNLLLANNQLNNAGFFILKEAPVSNIQLYYQGYDFSAVWGEVKVAGLGISPGDMNDSNWVRGYSVVVGVEEGEGEFGLLKSLRNYQQHQRVYKEERDAMILSNTWGDRNRDSRINEQFILKELEQAATLGVTHYQIDDGWETGISSNSALGGSLANIWRSEHYWDVNEKKFPNGLSPVIEAAKKNHIQITLWFNPSTDSSFKNWEKDADVLITQYKKYGISMWKIDGVLIADKQADINFRKFLDKVTLATDFNAVFNLDVTASRRFGYHYMHTYGNLFLENRYTDWTNYYPHYTLRNLWQLAKYIPAQRLQIEFLNKWRNASKYPANDFLAPANYSFDYLFAIAMVAQPLAWFEVTGLPEEAFGTAKLISKYKAISSDLHKGEIFPIGNEPSGFNWTGFQSIQQDKGYFLVYREKNQHNDQVIQTYLPANKKVKLELVAGDGASFATVTGEGGSLKFRISKEKSFALYRYSFIK